MNTLSHLDADGTARMVDIGTKPSTKRCAVAQGFISVSPKALGAIKAGNAPKGDVLGAARIAGIMAAKKAADLIPLCHPLALDQVQVDFSMQEGASHDETGIRAVATVSLSGKTGAEMEALTAVTTALLTIFDMTKALDKNMVIKDVCLMAKSGGKSGDWTRDGGANG